MPNLDGGKAAVSGARRQSRSLFVAAGRPYVNHVRREETSGAILDRIATREKPYVSNWDGDKGDSLSTRSRSYTRLRARVSDRSTLSEETKWH